MIHSISPDFKSSVIHDSMKRSTMVNNNKLRPPRKRKSDASLIDRSIGEGKKRDDVDRIGKSNEPIAFCFVAVVLASLSLSLSLAFSLSLHIRSLPGVETAEY